jgi:hypothetical protein
MTEILPIFAGFLYCLPKFSIKDFFGMKEYSRSLAYREATYYIIVFFDEVDFG